jgi:4-carboxymuconolactone decarboxylase
MVALTDRATERLLPLPAERWDDDVLAALEEGRAALLSDQLQQALDSRDTGVLSQVLPSSITTMLHHPELAGAFLAYNGVLLRDPALSSRHRELLVLRVAWRTGSNYEWQQHARMAPRYGISEDEVAAIAGSTGAWTALEADLLAAADQLWEQCRIDDTTWERLAERLDDRQLVELPFVVGTYACLAMAFNCFGLQPGSSGGPPQHSKSLEPH